MRANGYTLIELVVTTGIIAVLAVSAWPFLSRYQANMSLAEQTLSLQQCVGEASVYAKAPNASQIASYKTVVTAGSGTVASPSVCEVFRQNAGAWESVSRYVLTGAKVKIEAIDRTGLSLAILGQVTDEVTAAPPYTSTITPSVGTLPLTTTDIKFSLDWVSYAGISSALNLNMITGLTKQLP